MTLDRLARIIGLIALVLMFVGVAFVAGQAKDTADYAHDLSEQIRENAIEGCRRNVADRRIRIRESRASARANRIVARDPRQPLATRRARAWQARQNMRAVREMRKRVPPALICRNAY